MLSQTFIGLRLVPECQSQHDHHFAQPLVFTISTKRHCSTAGSNMKDCGKNISGAFVGWVLKYTPRFTFQVILKEKTVSKSLHDFLHIPPWRQTLNR